MAQAASYNVAGNREQILDVLTILEPEETPVVSMAKKLPATATFVEWQVDNLAQPNISGVSEGEDVSSFDNKAVNRTKLGNYVQKFRRQWMVSDIQELVNTAGVSSEVANSEAKSLRELKIDLEVAICSSEDRQAEGGAGSPYLTRGLGKWLGNADFTGAPADLPAAYTLPTGSSDNTGTISEAIFNSVLQSRYQTVGSANSKLTLVAGPALKTQISNFTRSEGAAREINYHVNQEATSKTVTFSVNVYDGDFGLVNIVPSLFNNRTAAAPDTLDDDFGYLIDPDLIGLLVLKAESNTELENQGGGRRGYTDVIAGLACFNPLGFGVFEG